MHTYIYIYKTALNMFQVRKHCQNPRPSRWRKLAWSTATQAPARPPLVELDEAML